jgi:hypothetical protein
MNKRLIWVATVVLCAWVGMAGRAWADGAAAEVKAAKGVENKLPVEEGTSFDKGTKVWVWSLVTGADGQTVKHVWKRDGKDEWTANLKIKSAKYTTHSRRNVRAGEYTVEVLAEDGSKIGEVSFSVK